MRLTPSQQQAVTHRGSNLLVSASAGSGKTEVLARRVVELVADERKPCAIERLLVVTFTRAAAAELRVRIARMLREAADKTRVPDLQSHLRRQAVLVDAADIGTIDGWCSRIVRAHAALTDVDAEFSALSEEDAGLLRGRVLDELFTWIYSADEPLAVAAREWLALQHRPDDGFLRDLIAGLNGYRAHLVEMEAWFERQRVRYGATPEELRADARRVLSSALADELAFQNVQLGELLEKLAEDAPAGDLQGYRDQLAAWHRALTGSPGSAARLTDVAAQIEAYALRKPRGLSNAAAALFEEVRERWLQGRLKERWSQQQIESSLEHAPAAAQLVNTLLGLEQRYEELLSAAKRSAAVAEFHDVLRWALDLLGTPAGDGPRQPTELARQLQEHYEHILVDEYQDTSPVQVELLRLVTRSAPGRSNRFMVGDVKQSIYGFRQAEPRLFAELVRRFEAGREEGAVCYLADNFRSQRDLVAGLNSVFSQLFDPSLGGTAFESVERLHAARADRPNPTLDGRARIDLHVFEHASSRGAAGPAENGEKAEADEEAVPLERIEREALVAAAEIQQMMSAGAQIPQRAPDDRISLRPLRYGDVVILLRAARQNAGVVARVLRDAGIPCVTSGRDALLAAPEVMDIRNVLALLANRRQDVPLAAYLRSPLVGLSAAELLQVRAAAPRGDFHAAVVACASGAGPVAGKVLAGLEQLDRWAELAREEELPELLRRIYADTDWLLFAQALPGGAHRVNLLRALHGYAVDFARQGHHGVAEFDAYLEDLAKAELAPGTPVAAGEDVVRIMTIHAAKGLEFPVVLLLNAGARFDRRDTWGPLLCDEELGLGLKYADYQGRRDLVTAAHHVLSARAGARSVEEELRLLYVATTRARERLLICGHAAAGAWEAARERFTEGRPPLATRLGAGSMLEWVIMATASAGLHEPAEDGVPPVRIVQHEAGATPVRVTAPAPPATAPHGWSDADEAWVARAAELLTTARSSAAASIPAVVTVSTLKELAVTAHGEDVGRALPAVAEHLSPPAFARSAAVPDGRLVGRAVHVYLEHADLTDLAAPAAVRGQLERLVSAGRISAEQAALVPVDDVAWFTGTELGRLLTEHAGRLQRELPFVYAWPVGADATILRGVIDCLVETSAGLVVVDYKTDRVSDEAALAERAAKYTTQLQIYAAVAARILDRPVRRAVLVFLRQRRLIEVPCGAGLPAVDLLAALAPTAP